MKVHPALAAVVAINSIDPTLAATMLRTVSESDPVFRAVIEFYSNDPAGRAAILAGLMPLAGTRVTPWPACVIGGNMTLKEWKTAMLYEAETLGQAEARTQAKESAAQELVKEGKFILGGTIGGVILRNGNRARWYKIASASSQA